MDPRDAFWLAKQRQHELIRDAEMARLAARASQPRPRPEPTRATPRWRPQLLGSR